ncbi:MAG TPA: hypothetical protein PLL30_10255 [Candidatus Krumholzibacteria bacterium]|nr:hypothetical protein [Candidatus Krumholzibacteria bacterium]HPD72143.1 hypothetical protein [Candidatus Krumholzibacteria bacterium]HRY40925.1 hypothetical protein [Candidatus Krumholzibacteria bacterium]
MTADARAALFGGLIDYAGLFPPADLDLGEALVTYDGHLHGPDSALLGRFVAPAARLEELRPWLAGTWRPGRPLRLAVVTALGNVGAVADFAASAPAARIEALDLSLPRDVSPAVWLDGVLAVVAQARLGGVEIHVELSPGRDRDLLAALGGRQGRPGVGRLGAKLRCGGVASDQVPPVERVAAVVAAARDAAVPLKFTAGLHHPLRGMGATGHAPMHGFLNVYGAALLAHDHGLEAADLTNVVADTEPASFRVDRDGFAWRDRFVAADRVAALRSGLIGGYGSCSFAEPLADLRSLAILT